MCGDAGTNTASMVTSEKSIAASRLKSSAPSPPMPRKSASTWVMFTAATSSLNP